MQEKTIVTGPEDFSGKLKNSGLTIFSYGFFPENFLINDLSSEFSRRGHTVEVLTGLPNYPQGDIFSGYSLLHGPYAEIYNGSRIIRFPMIPRKKGFKFLALNYLSNLIGALLLMFRLKPSRVAFVFGNSPLTTAIPAIVWAKLRGAKVVIWLQDLWPDSLTAVGAFTKKSLVYTFVESMIRWIYKHTDLMLVQSPAFEKNLSLYGYSGPIVFVPNWASELKTSDSSEPEWLRAFPEGFTVTFAGNLGKAQGLDTILGAAKILKNEPHIKFVLVGDGSDRQGSENEAQREGLTNVYFLGKHPPSDMPFLFKKSSALLVTLRKGPHLENVVPSKMQAYMNASKPILASLDGEGQRVLALAQGGLSSPAEDAAALANNIILLAALGEQKLHEMG